MCCIYAVLTASPVTDINTPILINITAVIAALASVIIVMFVAIVLLVSALCVCSRLHKHRHTQATLTNDTLYDEVNQAHCTMSERRGNELEETGQVYEDIEDATGVDGVLATTNVAYGVTGTDVPLDSNIAYGVIHPQPADVM